jgi:transposase-like protein
MCWSKRDLPTKLYVYFWADGIYVRARRRAVPCWSSSAPPSEGKKELVGLIDGARESAQGDRGSVAQTRGQCCWVHKTANVLDKLPKSQQSKAKRALQEIWMAETKKDALAAFDAFVETRGVKYERAVECLTKDREALLALKPLPPRTLPRFGDSSRYD